MSESKLTDFQSDSANANRGTERGIHALTNAIEKLGYTEPMVASADHIVLSGNKRRQVCVDRDMTDAIVVETDGTRPIIHVRTDVVSGTPEAYEIALAANRVAEVGLEWDNEVIAALSEEIDLNLWFREDELEELLAGVETPDFEPVPEDEQPRLDQKSPIVCPHCGVEFVPE